MCVVCKDNNRTLHANSPRISSPNYGGIQPHSHQQQSVMYARESPSRGHAVTWAPKLKLTPQQGWWGLGAPQITCIIALSPANIIRVNNMTRVTRQKINICLVVHPSHYFIHLIFSRNLISTDLSRRFQPRSASD